MMNATCMYINFEASTQYSARSRGLRRCRATSALRRADKKRSRHKKARSACQAWRAEAEVEAELVAAELALVAKEEQALARGQPARMGPPAGMPT